MSPYATSLEAIKKARKTISAHAVVTPILTNSSLDDVSNRRLFFKCETFQRGGAFKFRGACNAVFSLSDEDAAKGVVTHSSGNHGGALALAAKLRGIPAYVIVPKTTPKFKVDAIKEHGGQVTYADRSIESRVAACEKVQQETQATLIPPYNFGPVMSGQGTVGLEILDQIPIGVDAVVVPVSGGGLISGILVAIKSINPKIKVFAAEPTGTNDAADVAKSILAGKLIDCPFPKTAADGLMGKPGDLTWPVIKDLVDGVVTVGEEEILAAVRLCYEKMKVAVEPSGAVTLAAVLSKEFQTNPVYAQCSRICLVLSGGNVDLEGKGLWDTNKWAPL